MNFKKLLPIILLIIIAIVIMCKITCEDKKPTEPPIVEVDSTKCSKAKIVVLEKMKKYVDYEKNKDKYIIKNCILYYSNAAMIKYKANTSPNDKIRIATDMDAQLKFCPCFPDNVALLEFDTTQTIDLEGKIRLTTGNVDVEEGELLPVIFASLTDPFLDKNPSFDSLKIPIQLSANQNGDGPVLALLDSGFDFDYPDLDTYTHFSFVELDRCKNSGKPIETIGINLIDDSQAPYDFHGHGTHVGGIIIQRMQEVEKSFKMMIVKTHDDRGISDPFKVYCGMRFAQQNKADVINASFGWYHYNSAIIDSMIGALESDGIAIVTSAGNEGWDVDEENNYHYPSGYNHKNIFSTASLNGSKDLVETSFNYGKSTIDYATPGIRINSFIPTDRNSPELELKDGTSMSAAHLSAAVLSSIECGHKQLREIRDHLKNLTNSISLIEIDEGPIINIDCP